jgi:CBS domain-containing protein
MSISDVMTSDLPTVAPADTIRDVARRMTECKVKALPVCEGDLLVGIVTDWDVTRAVASAESAAEHAVREFMSTDLVTVPPYATFSEAAETMAERQLHHLLISDGGRFEGMVHLDCDWSDLGGVAGPIATFTAPI